MTTTTKKKKPLSWRAVRRGPIYCAPACGHGCTFAAYQRAKAAAERLAAQLGPGWKTRVNENMGWHWSVHGGGGHLHISPFYYKGKIHSFTVFVSDTPEKCCIGRWTAEGDTAKQALEAAIAKAMGEAARITREMAHLQNALRKVRS